MLQRFHKLSYEIQEKYKKLRRILKKAPKLTQSAVRPGNKWIASTA